MMDQTNLKQKVQQIIDENLYMTISVASLAGEPWIANVFFAQGDDGSFYWYSSKDSVHSNMIRQNPKIAIAIFNSTAVGDEVDAVYIKANAYEVTDKLELLSGLKFYAQKMLKSGFETSKAQIASFIDQIGDFQGLSQLRLYKAVPEKIYKLAPSKEFNGKYIDSRIEIEW